MAVTAKQFAKLHSQLSLKQAYTSNTAKCALFTATCSPSQSADTLFTAAPYTSNQVAAANGYATGGVALASLSLATAALVTTFDSADPSWTVTGAGFTWRYAVIYDTTSGVVISYIDMGADQVWTTPGTYGLTLDAAGIARITVS